MNQVAAVAALAATMAASPALAQVAEEPRPAQTPHKDVFKREGKPEQRAAKDALEGNKPPALAVTQWMNTKEGGLSWADLEGKVVLLKFWGVWCGPCRKSMPHTMELAHELEERGLVVIGIHTQGSAEKMASYVKDEGIDFPVALDADGKTVKAFAVDSFPDYYLVDRTGVVRVADLQNSEVEGAVRALLDEEPPPLAKPADASANNDEKKPPKESSKKGPPPKRKAPGGKASIGR